MQWPGEDLIGRLWDTVANRGIGGLLKPWQMRREGRASTEVKRDELLVLAQAERDAERIKRGELTLAQVHGNRGGIEANRPRVEPHLDPMVLREIAAEVSTADVIRREINVTRALLHAEAELDGDGQKPPEEKVDEDWLYRWRDNASQVSTEELQSLWGRLLAGEVKAPGTFSLRTLEFLKNLSHAEAASIARLAGFSVNGWIFRQDPEFLDQFGLPFRELLELQQLGVISGAEGLGLNITMHSQPVRPHTISLRYGDWVLVAEADTPSKPCVFPCLLITPLGRQVLSLCKDETRLDYLRKVGAFMKGEGFEVKMARYIHLSDTQFMYANAESL